MRIEVEELRDRIQSGDRPVVLDVREDWEREVASLEGTLNIPMAQIPARMSEVTKDEPVVVMCHHGARSWQVTAFLMQQGFTNVENLEGGIHAWAERIDPATPRY